MQNLVGNITFKFLEDKHHYRGLYKLIGDCICIINIKVCAPRILTHVFLFAGMLWLFKSMTALQRCKYENYFLTDC